MLTYGGKHASLITLTNVIVLCIIIHMNLTLQIMACPSKVTPNSSCCVIGSTQLAINCSLILLRKGFEIKRVYTNDEIFCSWADDLSITHYSIGVMKKFELTSGEAKFDYLFSIVNDTLVPKHVLENVEKLSINYHNGPLPKYAGTNAVNWAMIKGETRHGISWHVMEKEFDSGIILAKEEFVIEESDSLIDVNWKCMQSAERSLENLCEALNKGMYIQHDKGSLMYFKLERKPTPLCLLPLNLEAKQIYNFFRGSFHLRSQPNGINELGLPKILLPSPYGKVLIVSEMNVFTERIFDGYEAGTVVTVEETIVITVGNNTCIEITDLLELDGTSIKKPYSLQFPSLLSRNLMISEYLSEDSKLWEISNIVGRNDRRWSKRMSRVKKEIESKGAIALTWPYYSTFTPSVAESSPVSIPFCTLCNEVVQNFKTKFPNYNVDIVCLASFATFLLALSPSSSPGYCDVAINGLPKLYVKLLLNFAPVLLDYSKESSLLELIEMNCKQFLRATCLESATEEEKRKFWVSSDVYFRYPIDRLRTSIAFNLASISNFDLLGISSQKVVISCVQEQEKVILTAQFSNNDFHPCSFSSIEKDFFTFINAFFENPSSNVGLLPLCNDKTRKCLLTCKTLNGPAVPMTFSSLHEPFLKIAEQFPHKIAIVDEEGQYTYDELKKRAIKIASVIGQPHRVALILERTWEFIASMMAVLIVGASFVPIEPHFPLEYIQYIVNDSQSEVVIVDKFTTKFQQVKCKKHVHLNLVLAQSPYDVLSNKSDLPNNAEAAVLYTSGTTGTPKGVLLTHSGLINVLESVMNLIKLSNSEIPNDYILHSSSTTFDSFFLETFPPLWIGRTIIFHPTNPIEWSRNQGFLKYVNFLHTQPVKLSFFKPDSFVSLNRLTFGGEAPTMNLLQPWLKVCANSWNIYGPTETSVITTAANINDRIHLGNCIQNAHLRILSPSMQIVPQGVSGELHIGGVGVALGYTNSGQTESFWRDSSNKSFYKTGDLVYFDHDNTLNFIGRLPKNRQIKIGGVRIELSGIEHIIRQHEGVKFVRVIKEQQTDKNDILVAYVCPEYVDCKKIHSYLNKVLPLQSIPALIIPVQEDELKFSTSGKVQMKNVGYKSYIGSKTLPSTSTEVEKTVLDIYQQCLGLVNDDIFGLDSKIAEFGGNSITILHLVGELRTKLKWDIIPSDVIDYTPALLISKYSQQGVSLKARETVVTDSDSRTDVISGSQQALLSMDHISLGPTYNIPYTFKILGDQISCTRLLFALYRVLELIASTVCGKTSSGYGEVIQIDLSAFPTDKGLRDAIHLSQKNALLPIDLRKVPYRCTLYYVGKGCYVLNLVIHHISFDYSSWNVLQQVLQDAYNTSSTKSSPIISSDIYHLKNIEHQTFWKEEMKDCNLTVRLPTTFTRMGARPFVGKRLLFKLDICDTTIKRFCHGIKISPSVLFLSAYGLMVHWLSKESSFGIGVNISQRHTANLKMKVGFLTTTVICKFPEDILVGCYFDLLRYIQSWQEKVIHCSIPIYEIIKYSQQEHSAQKYLPQLIFNYISNYKKPSLSLGEGIVSEFVELSTRTSKAELVLDVNHDGQCYNIVWEYCTSLFSDAYINNLNNHLSSVIADIMHGVQKSFSMFEASIRTSVIAPDGYSSKEALTIASDTTSANHQLSFYQNSLLQEELISVDHLSGGLHASAIILLDEGTSKDVVEHAIHKVLSECKFLVSHIRIQNDSACLSLPCSQHIGITCEIVASEMDELAIKLREHLWPFDLFSGPLLRFTQVHNTRSNQRYILVTTHQILLNEFSLKLLCKQFESMLKQTTDIKVLQPYCIQQEDQKSMKFWIELMAKHGRPSPLSTEYHYCSPCVIFETISENIPFSFECQDDLVIQCSVFTSFFLWKLKKPLIIQFCLLNDISKSTVSHISASDELCPIAIDFDLYKAKSLKKLYDLIEEYLTQTLEHLPPCYWKLQEQISPFCTFADPYHDILLQVSNRSVSESVDIKFPRPFKIQLHINACKRRIELITSLNSQQTTIVQKCFAESMAFFSENDSVLLQIHNSPSYSLGSFSCTQNSGSLSLDIEHVLQSHPNSILYSDIARKTPDTSTDIPCFVTAKEFYNQVKATSNQLRALVKDKISANVVIVTEGGYEMPIAMVAAVLCRCAFFIIQSTDEQILMEKLQQIDISVVLYDRFRFSTVETIAEKMCDVTFMFVSTFHENVIQQDVNESNFVERPLCSNSCAYMVFTSGSTGTPKLIQNSEKSLHNFLTWYTEKFASSTNVGFNWLQLAHPHFDAVVVEVLGQLLLTNNLVLIDFTNRLNNSYMTTVLRRYHINCLHTTPTILSQFLQGKNLQNIIWDCKTLPDLLHVFSGGERVSFDHYSTFLQRFQPTVSFHNWGGPAEACMAYAHCEFNELPCLSSLPMGTVITNAIVDVLSECTQLPLPRGMIGEIAVSGLPISTEYLRASELYKDSDNRCWYLTGDIGYINCQNQVVLLYRKDTQVKINSERIDIDGIREMILKLKLSNVLDVIIDIFHDAGSKKELVCFPIVSSNSIEEKCLQEQMLELFLFPKIFLPRVIKCFEVDQIPKLVTGKIDHRKLQELARTPKPASKYSSFQPISSYTEVLLECIRTVLPHTTELDDSKLLHMSLDHLGMNSLHKAQFHELVYERNIDISMNILLLSRNLYELAQKIIEGSNSSTTPLKTNNSMTDSEKVVIIAMDINVPGAKSCDEFWDVIENCRETITHDLPNMSDTVDERYVGSRGIIDGIEYFDAPLFNIHDEEAKYMDPQQRLLLQAVWTCMEKAGYDPTKFSQHGRIGCFAATQFPQYLIECIQHVPQSHTGDVIWGNLRDNVALRIGRCFDFRGPCITFVNNCASQAVALHYARVSLLCKECDIAVVAAATISAKKTGYIYKEMDIYSQDGHCYPFSKAASGTVMSDGLTVLVLRRLSDARLNNDHIACIVTNTATGSDGVLAGTKSYSPSTKGQIETLTKALENVQPSTIDLVEAHGAATRIGDEIEIESLKCAFKDVKHPIVLGSVKGNIGHLGVASAGAGVIKAVLALKNRKFPPCSKHDLPITGLQKSVFCCIDTTREWVSLTPRRVLVHSIGVLGVNSAIVLEEYISTVPYTKTPQPFCVPLCISAKTEWSLRHLYQRIVEYASKHPDTPLVDIAYSLCYGRIDQQVRFAKVLSRTDQLNGIPESTNIAINQTSTNHVCIAFSGQGRLVSTMAFRSYSECIPEFRQSLSNYCDILEHEYPQHFPPGLTEILTNRKHQNIEVNFQQPVFQHLLTVVFQLALYSALQQLGINANIVMGHSLGEYTAAYVAGFLSAKDVLNLVYKRAISLEQEIVPKGLMVAVSLSGEECASKYLRHFPSLEIACFNSPQSCVVSGPIQDIESLCSQLGMDKVRLKILDTMHIAYHHSNLRVVNIPDIVSSGSLSSIQMISTLKSDHCLLPANSELDSHHWKNHLITPVDFPQALSTLLNVHDPSNIRVIEIGIGEYLKVFAFHMDLGLTWSTLAGCNESMEVVSCLSEIWKIGIPIELFRLPLFSGAKRCQLPTYVFDSKRYWIDEIMSPSQTSNLSKTTNVSVASKSDLAKPHKVLHTKDSVLSLIRSITGPGYEEHLPTDSFILIYLQERILNEFSVDISELLKKQVHPNAVAHHIVAHCKDKLKYELLENINPIVDLSTSKLDKPDRMFIIHAVGGEMFSFRPLAALISQSCQVFGVHSSHVLRHFSTVEEIASFYCSKIKLVQNQGPFIIGGHSYGAWIAHSVAQFLEESGQSVSMLVMIDPPALDTLKPTTSNFVFERAIVLSDVYVKHFIKNPNKDMMEGMITQLEKQVNELINYRGSLQQLSCGVRVFLATERLHIDGYHLKETDHWKLTSSGDINVIEVPGSHSSCISSVNCFHIAANLPFKNLDFEYPIPPSSTAEIVGTWILDSITCTIPSMSLFCKKTKLYLTDDEEYICMVPRSDLVSTSSVYLDHFSC